MNPELARITIVETFRQKFDDARFLYFIRNLVNPVSVTFDESKKQTWTLKKAAFEDYVNHFARLGTYSDPDGEKVDVLVIHLRKDTTLARGRVTLRNFVADYLATGHGQGKAAVMAAFVSPQEEDWRFSFVKLDYTFEKTDLGFVSERRLLTPARRYSYLVGKNENCHTAQKQFLALLEADQKNPSVAQLETAFSVEKVTREFYDYYKALFERTRDALAAFLDSTPGIKKHFSERGIECDDFAKKLLGQIIFLYFLQKKGWFGVERGKPWGSGRKDFIRHLFTNRADYAHVPGQRKRPANFFNDILEPLFYEAIAAPRTDDDHYYSRFDCRIPFLNGGLFEPLYGYNWVETDILLPDTLFSNDEPSPEKGETGTGILDVFDRYNFTVNEAEPLEKEVAVDPEMLGLVFENLLPENIRHSSGTYYTPRVIVHYMCQQALLLYLCTRMGVKDDQTLTPALSLSERERENRSQSPGKSGVTIHQDAANVSPSPGGEGRGEGGRSVLTRNDLALFLRLAERYADFEATDTKAHADKRLPDTISRNAARLDQLLATITVCDLAIGSGAFAVGMMHEIVRARMALTPCLEGGARHSVRAADGHDGNGAQGTDAPYQSRSAYALKRHAIQHSLYGVDLDPGAVEIAKLRLWLSMVVDEDNLNDIQPLPNLDYKIMQGNSLLEEFDGVRLLDEKLLQPPDEARDGQIAELKARLSALQAEAIRQHAAGKKGAALKLAAELEVKRLKKQLAALTNPSHASDASHQGELHQQTSWASLKRIQELHEKFFDEDSRTEKDKLRRELDTLEWSFMEATLREQGRDEAIAELKRASTTHRKPFFLWRLHFGEIFQQRGGFDVIIANPPYVRMELIMGDKPALKNRYPHLFAGRADLYVYFFGLGLDILRDGGCLTFISSNTYLNSKFGEKLRKYFRETSTIETLIDFAETKVFDAVVEPAIIVQRKVKAADTPVRILKWQEGLPLDQLPEVMARQSSVVPQDSFTDEPWRLESPVLLRLLDRLKSVSKPLGSYVEGDVLRGVVSGLNEAFVIDGATRNRLLKDPRNKEIIKPFLRGRDISQWTTQSITSWLIYTYHGIDISRYPLIKEHLLPFKKALEARATEQAWYELQQPQFRYSKFFEKPKIIYQDIARYFGMAWDDTGAYLANTCYFIPTSEKWLLGILLSSTMQFYVQKTIGSDEGGFIRLFAMHVKKFPIPSAPPEKQKAVERLVDRILAAKARDAAADVSALEREIDQLVYALYGLTPEEIKIVEGAAK